MTNKSLRPVNQRRQMESALAKVSEKMLSDAERSLRIAHLYGDLREALALVAGCALARGEVQREALAPMARQLGGIQTALLVAVQPRSEAMRKFVANEVSAIVTEYIQAIEGVVNGRLGADERLLELAGRHDDQMKKLAALRETTRPGPKTSVTTQQIRDTTVIMVLAKIHAGLSQEDAIEAVKKDLSEKPNPDQLEAAILSKMEASTDAIKMVQKWLERGKNAHRQIDSSVTKLLT